eukprot:CAMPEP_0175110332 /NCGR_PEP_ID=MMETSP0086_2-20121207/14006_1 /TAXON_ID=136419 /ORGANISM="Unknown Unknown, Strain D1" /LENGTH=327 /DNA_ID=CAMNT_0016388387 /DNA_START=61 /DNA_END=1041 /DNA_ORIENTATION=+
MSELKKERPTILVVHDNAKPCVSSCHAIQEIPSGQEFVDERKIYKPADPFSSLLRKKVRRPPLVGVSHIQVQSDAPYKLAGPLHANSRPWYDRDHRITGALTGELESGVLIQTCMEDRDRDEWNFCSFVVDQPCYVYLLVVRSKEACETDGPTIGGDWLERSFDCLSSTVELDWDEPADLAVWRSKQVVSRGKVIIGGPSSNWNYSIVIKSIYSSMLAPSVKPRTVQLYSDFFNLLPDSIVDPYRKEHTQVAGRFEYPKASPTTLEIEKHMKRKRHDSPSCLNMVDSFFTVHSNTCDPNVPGLLSPELSEESDPDSLQVKRAKPNDW